MSKQDSRKIIVSGQRIYIEEEPITAKEILVKAGFEPDQYELYLVIGEYAEIQKQEQPVEIKNGLRFSAIKNDVT